MELLTLAVYLPIAAVALLFVYLTTGWLGTGLALVCVVLNLLPSASQPKP